MRRMTTSPKRVFLFSIALLTALALGAPSGALAETGLDASSPAVQPDGVLDVVPSAKANNSSSWNNNSSTVSSPVFGAVLWVLGNVSFSGSVGVPGSVNFECGATAGCNPTVMPYGTFPVSIVALGNISLSGSSNVSPANPDAGYYYLFVSGRDLVVSGNTQEDTQACGGTCSVSSPSDIEKMASSNAASWLPA